MNVPPTLECGHELRIAGEMRQQPELDLRIVGRQEQAARRRNEGAANLLTPLGPNGDVLQVRIG